MGGCSAPNCSNSTTSGKQLFRFPKDAKRRRIWAVNCRQDFEPPPHSRLCQVGVITAPLCQVGVITAPLCQVGVITAPLCQVGVITAPLCQVGVITAPLCQVGVITAPLCQVGVITAPLQTGRRHYRPAVSGRSLTARCVR